MVSDNQILAVGEMMQSGVKLEAALEKNNVSSDDLWEALTSNTVLRDYFEVSFEGYADILVAELNRELKSDKDDWIIINKKKVKNQPRLDRLKMRIDLAKFLLPAINPLKYGKHIALAQAPKKAALSTHKAGLIVDKKTNYKESPHDIKDKIKAQKEVSTKVAEMEVRTLPKTL